MAEWVEGSRNDQVTVWVSDLHPCSGPEKAELPPSWATQHPPPPPSESCPQAVFVPAAKGSYFSGCGLLEEKAAEPFLPRVPLSLRNNHVPLTVRHPGIKPCRKPQRVQETKCRKTEKGVGQALLPSLGRQSHRRHVPWAEAEIPDHSLMPQLLSEFRVPGLGDTAVFAQIKPLPLWNLPPSGGERQKSVNKKYSTASE